MLTRAFAFGFTKSSATKGWILSKIIRGLKARGMNKPADWLLHNMNRVTNVDSILRGTRRGEQISGAQRKGLLLELKTFAAPDFHPRTAKSSQKAKSELLRRKTVESLQTAWPTVGSNVDFRTSHGRTLKASIEKKGSGPEIEETAPDASSDTTMPPAPAPTPPVEGPQEKKHRAKDGIRAIILWARRRRECPPGKALDEETGRCLPMKRVP